MEPITDKERAAILKKFMKDNFDFSGMVKMGIFTKEIRNDYPAQAAIICDHFGYKEVYEYGKEPIRCHISYAGDRPLHVNDNGKLKEDPFITEIPSTWDGLFD